MMKVKAAYFDAAMILLSTCQLEELILERGVLVDHPTINDWVVKYASQLKEMFYCYKYEDWNITR